MDTRNQTEYIKKISTVPNFSGLFRNQVPSLEVPKYNKLVPN